MFFDPETEVTRLVELAAADCDKPQCGLEKRIGLVATQRDLRADWVALADVEVRFGRVCGRADRVLPGNFSDNFFGTAELSATLADTRVDDDFLNTWLAHRVELGIGL